MVPVNFVSYEVFLLLQQFLYNGQVLMVQQKRESRRDCGERRCWHTHCAADVDFALDTLAASPLRLVLSSAAPPPPPHVALPCGRVARAALIRVVMDKVFSGP
jgi:hypothetical protein